MQKSNNNII